VPRIVRYLVPAGLAVAGLMLFKESAPVRVDFVPDGDTLVLAGGERVRVLGVDAPELHPCQCEAECRLGRNARDLVAVAVGPGVLVSRRGRDRYDRTLAVVRLQDGTDLAQLLIRNGLGRPYRGGARESWCAAPPSRG
jgi:endonuclease YncB( thermonuclease family)